MYPWSFSSPAAIVEDGGWVACLGNKLPLIVASESNMGEGEVPLFNYPNYATCSSSFNLILACLQVLAHQTSLTGNYGT